MRFGKRLARVETWNEVDQKPLFFTNLYHGKIVSCSINLSNSEWLFKKLNRSEELFVFATIEHSSYGGKAKGDAVNSKYVKKKKKMQQSNYVGRLSRSIRISIRNPNRVEAVPLKGCWHIFIKFTRQTGRGGEGGVGSSWHEIFVSFRSREEK